jgi:hypothetical protein
MSRDITLPDATGDVRVVLQHDGLEVIYRPVAVVRSVARKIREAQHELDRLAAKDEQALSLEEIERMEEQSLRRVCDLINYVVATDTEGAPPAGDMLFAGWEADEVTEGQIYRFVANLNRARAEDPTPA